jgi:type IV pilus assembly protein PilF
MRCRHIFQAVLLAAFLGGCATSGVEPDHSGSGRSGMDRVSPVRAADINTRLGVGYFERGDLQLAVEKLERAIELDPAHVPAHVTMALVRERLGQSSRARRHYREAVELAPGDGATLNSYAAFLCRNGEYAEAEKLFGRAVNDPFYRTPEVAYTNAGACALRNDEHERALGYLRQALEHDEQYAAALYQLARVYVARDEAFRGRAFLQRYESVAGADPASLALGFRIERELGNEREAARYFQKLEAEFPNSNEARELRQLTSKDD